MHEYEQLGKSKKSRVAVNPKAELDETGEYLRSKIKALEEELAVLKEGPFGPRSEFMQALSPEDREFALQALRENAETPEEDVDDMDLTEFHRLIEDHEVETHNVDSQPAPQIILGHSKENQSRLRHFNAALRDMVVDSTPTKAKKLALWQSYQGCREHVPDFLSLVPAQVWEMLWQSQTEPTDRYRTTKATVLARHMRSQSLPLSAQQALLYMEGLQSTGDLPGAIECWNENRSTLGPNAEVARRFWSLGVQLYSENNQPEEAENIAKQCLSRGSFADATILVPVVISWARKDTMYSLEKAWACYLRIKTELGAAMRPENYQSISTTLLNQGHPDMALGVFKDMVLETAKQKDHDSVSVLRKLGGHVGDLQSSAINEQEVSKVSLSALTVLPRFLQNKFFFGSWIKKLIGLGDVDAASKVVELMYARGVRPDARHLNGIIGAWLRDKTLESEKKAEQMAWTMINARIEFVRKRRLGLRSQKGLIKSPEGHLIPTFIQRPVPPATIETFSLLLLHYTRRSQDDSAEQLMTLMTTRAMIAPNAFIWNHWLYASLRVRDLASVWRQYTIMKSKVKPDLETFACLWDTAKVQWDASKSTHSSEVPTTRHLFKEMNDWISQLSPGPLLHAKQEFSKELHDQIIRVFCLSNDLRGTLCALHGLTHLFGQFPDDATSRLIVIQIARLLPPDPNHRPSGRRGSRVRVGKMDAAIAAVNEILQIVSDQRAVALMDSGLDPQEMDEPTTKQFQLDVLSDLLVVFLNRVAGATANVDNETRAVAGVMGVEVEGVDFRKEELLLLRPWEVRGA